MAAPLPIILGEGDGDVTWLNADGVAVTI